MISDVADLLKNLMSVEAALIETQGIKHAPTIGAMYEGLTRDVVDRTIPPSLDLRVVQGFIEDGAGYLSTQIDCMLVTGEGRKLPHVDSHVWHLSRVISIIEVKKNLYGSDLESAFVKQRAVHHAFCKYMEQPADKEVRLAPMLSGFAKLTGKYVPSYSDAKNLPDFERIIFHLMVTELLAPLRIILGYEGYADEFSLRTGMLDFLSTNVGDGTGEAGFGAFSLPNLMVCRNNSILKLNGYPYLSPIDNGWWHILCSNSENPLRLLIELIWTRLENQFDIALPSDTNLHKERIAPLLKGKVRALEDGKWGWIYEAVEIARDNLTQLQAEEWVPETIESYELTLLLVISEDGFVDVTDEHTKEFAKDNGADARSIVDSLVKKRLLAWQSETVARPIYESFQSIYGPDGKIYIMVPNDLAGAWLSRKLDLQGKPLRVHVP